MEFDEGVPGGVEVKRGEQGLELGDAVDQQAHQQVNEVVDGAVDEPQQEVDRGLDKGNHLIGSVCEGVSVKWHKGGLAAAQATTHGGPPRQWFIKKYVPAPPGRSPRVGWWRLPRR